MQLSEHLSGSGGMPVNISPIEHVLSVEKDTEDARKPSHHFQTLFSLWLAGASCSTHWLNFITVHM